MSEREIYGRGAVCWFDRAEDAERWRRVGGWQFEVMGDGKGRRRRWALGVRVARPEEGAPEVRYLRMDGRVM